MSKLTEENIFLHFMPLVISECRNAYKGLELEDRIAEGEHVLIYAIRTYRVRYGCFSDYLIAQLQRILKQKNSEAWILKKLEAQLSLDAPLFYGEEGYTLLSQLHDHQSYESALEVKLFIDALSLTLSFC